MFLWVSVLVDFQLHLTTCSKSDISNIVFRPLESGDRACQRRWHEAALSRLPLLDTRPGTRDHDLGIPGQHRQNDTAYRDINSHQLEWASPPSPRVVPTALADSPAPPCNFLFRDLSDTGSFQTSPRQSKSCDQETFLKDFEPNKCNWDNSIPGYSDTRLTLSNIL